MKNPRKKKISYQILPGELFHLDSIEFRDFPLSIDTLIRQSMDESLLKRNDPFNVPTLSNERDRIASLLRNRGHYFFRSEHIAYRADTLMRPEHVQLQVLPSPTMTQAAKQPFHIGKTRITILKYNTRELTDSFSLRNLSMQWSGGKKRKPSALPRPRSWRALSGCYHPR